jgi:hypothetical protein
VETTKENLKKEKTITKREKSLNHKKFPITIIEKIAMKAHS